MQVRASRYAALVSARDTTDDAAAVRVALYRAMTPDQRCTLAAELSAATRAIALDSIRRRHPSYTEHQTRMALYRLLLGDELFRRAWPDEALLAA
jgi:hypothetical protein